MDVSLLDEAFTPEEIAVLIECDKINQDLAEMEAAFGPYIPRILDENIPF